MRTRCPRCQTVFRITPEQLRVRSGKVRCGHCQAIFNALETLIEEPAVRPAIPPTGAELLPEQPIPMEIAAAAPEPVPEPVPEVPESVPEPVPEPSSEPAPAQEPDLSEISSEAHPPRGETLEETTSAAREAGLVAPRELTESPGYNRWAAAPLADPGSGSRQRPTWLFAISAVLLTIVLAAQAIYHFRTAIAQHLPVAASAFKTLGIAVPLPQEANLVSIEASDLQSGNNHGLLVLQATLKNRAPYAQAWPALELTLTDTLDAVVARRVLAASDYLPPEADPRAFAAGSEIGVRLWIEAKGLAAAGYRLYVFYL